MYTYKHIQHIYIYTYIDAYTYTYMHAYYPQEFRLKDGPAKLLKMLKHLTPENARRHLPMFMLCCMFFFIIHKLMYINWFVSRYYSFLVRFSISFRCYFKAPPGQREEHEGLQGYICIYVYMYTLYIYIYIYIYI